MSQIYNSKKSFSDAVNRHKGDLSLLGGIVSDGDKEMMPTWDDIENLDWDQNQKGLLKFGWVQNKNISKCFVMECFSGCVQAI